MQAHVRWAVAVGVLALHLALLRLAAPLRPPAAPPPASPASPALTVRLLEPPAPDRAPPAPRGASRPERPPAAPPQAVLPIGVPSRAITLPPAAGAAGRPADPAPTASAAAARVEPRALDLRLPPPALRGAAAARPPALPRPRSVESRLAQSLEAGPLRKEALGDGRLRLRQGTRCVELREARAARLDPFNQSVSPTPRQAEDCRH